MADIFLSYKREDRPAVETLAEALEATGLTVWWDTDLPLGKSYTASISGALAAAKVVIPVWTARSVQSEWVQEEATSGKRRGVLIPVRLEAVEPPIGFGMVQTADLSDWTPGDASHPEWIKLTESVRALIGGQVSATTSEPRMQPTALRRGKMPNPVRKVAMVAAGVVVVCAGIYVVARQQLAESPSPEVVASAQTQPAPAATPAAPQPAPTVQPAAMPEPETSQPAAADPAAFETSAGTQPAPAEPAATPEPAPAAPVPAAEQNEPGTTSYTTRQGLAVNSFVFSPDGRSVLSAGNDGTVKLLNAATGKELKQFAGLGPHIMQALYSSNSRYAVVGASDGSVTTVELSSKNRSGRFLTPTKMYQMAVSPDDGSIAVLNIDNKIRVYQADGVLLKTFGAKQEPNIYGFAWCPDSNCILLWGKNGMLEVWNPFVPELVDSLRGHAGVVRAAAFSADGKLFATVADDKQVLVWDATSGKRKGALPGLKESPLALAWSRDNKRIAIETESGKAFVWTVAGGKPSIVGPERGLGKGWLAFTPDSTGIVLGGWKDGPKAIRLPD